MKDGKPLRLRKGMIKDSTDKIPIIFFESLIEQISEICCYNMTKMRVQRYLDERIMKANVTYEVSSHNDIEVTTSGDDDDDDDDDDDVYISPDETRIAAKVMALYLKTLFQTYLCSNCNVSVSIENGLAWCNNFNVSLQSACKSKAYLRLAVLKDNHQPKLHIDVSHSRIERKFDLSLSNTAQKVIVCKVINKTFLFTIDRFNECTDLLIVSLYYIHFVTS